MVGHTRLDKRAKTDVTFGNKYAITNINDAEIQLLCYLMDSLCPRELTGEGRQFIHNEINKRGGNYSK